MDGGTSPALGAVSVHESVGGVCAPLAELANAIPIAAWCVVGDVMVAIHAAEHGVVLPPHRPTEALEILVETGRLPQGGASVEHALEDGGFTSTTSPASRDRYEKNGSIVEVVTPVAGGRRGGRRADISPHDPYSQALLRAGPVSLAGGMGQLIVRRPMLLGALLLEADLASTCEEDGDVIAARRAFAFLLTLADKPMLLRTQMRADESRQFRGQAELLDPDHPAWMAMEGTDTGRQALRLLAS